MRSVVVMGLLGILGMATGVAACDGDDDSAYSYGKDYGGGYADASVSTPASDSGRKSADPKVGSADAGDNDADADAPSDAGDDARDN
jgi:hypothetical protein